MILFSYNINIATILPLIKTKIHVKITLKHLYYL